VPAPSPSAVDPRQPLSQAWKALGGDERLLPGVSFSNDGPWLPSRFEVGALAAATIAAAALAAAELWSKRLGAPMRRVGIDRRHAEAAFISEQLYRPLGWKAPDLLDMLTGNYRAADGWIRLHTNYTYHRDAALRVLGTNADKQAVAEAVSRCQAHELETAIVEAGGCAAELRTIEAWASHPQGAAVAVEPLVAREGRITPRLERRNAESPLAGVRVLDMTRVIAGPFGTRFLAAMGADVLRVDPTGFEEVGAILPEATRGKRTAFLDLRSEGGRGAWEALVRDADVLVHGYRAGAVEALGYDEERIRSISPNLAIVRLDAYGWAGPWSHRRGFDSLVQMSSGIAHPIEGGKPTPLPAQALDHGTGYLVAAAACRALCDGTATSRVSLARTARFLVELGTGGDARAPGLGNVDDLLEPSPMAWGDSLQLRNPAAIEGYEACWRHEPGPLGRHEARWEG
jgi:hypothetical protein